MGRAMEAMAVATLPRYSLSACQRSALPNDDKGPPIGRMGLNSPAFNMSNMDNRRASARLIWRLVRK